jgi:hypothetical protein
MKMMNGPQQPQINGFLKKMRKWKSIFKRNLEAEKSIPKNNSWKMIEKSLSSLSDSKERSSFYTFS